MENPQMKKGIFLCIIFGLLIPTFASSQLSTNERLARLEGAVEQMSKRVEELRTDISARIANLESSLNATKSEINERLSALEARYDSLLRWTVGILIGMVGVLIAGGVTLGLAFGSLKGRVERLEEKVSEIQVDMKEMRSQMEFQMREMHSQLESQIKETHIQLEMQIQQLSAKIDRLIGSQPRIYQP
jgi:outer membrane murein-binding lipoprotein Lpp